MARPEQTEIAVLQGSQRANAEKSAEMARALLRRRRPHELGFRRAFLARRGDQNDSKPRRQLQQGVKALGELIFSLEIALFFELAHDPFIDHILGFELAEFCVDAAQDAYGIAQALDGWENSPAVKFADRFLPGCGVFGMRQAQPFHQYIDDALLVGRIFNICDRLGNGFERTLGDIR